MKQFLFFMASLLLVANSFSQKKVVYSNVALIKYTDGETSAYSDKVVVEWKGNIDNVDNVKKVFINNYVFTITEPFEILSEKSIENEMKTTFSSKAVDENNIPYKVGLVRTADDGFMFVFYNPEDTSNAISFMVTLRSGRKKSIDPKKF